MVVRSTQTVAISLLKGGAPSDERIELRLFPSATAGKWTPSVNANAAPFVGGCS